MRSYAQDPLVQYLEKNAQQLETNIDDLAVQVMADAVQARESSFEGTPAESKKADDDALLKALFTNYPNEKTSRK